MIEQLRARPLASRGPRYLVIACFCAAAHNAIMIVGERAGGGYPAMTLLSFATLTPTAYALHARYTFASRWSVRSLMRFVTGSAMALPISLLVMALLCTVLRLPVFIAAPIATAALFVWNYLAAHLSIAGRLRWKRPEQPAVEATSRNVAA